MQSTVAGLSVERSGTASTGSVEGRRKLTAARFAGDAVLDACYNGEHRMLAPEAGPAVAKIQQALVELGYALPRHGVDGRFGAETAAAVGRFKRDRGIAPSDGVVGPKTMTHLDAIFGDAPGPVPPLPVPPVPDVPGTLVVFAGIPARKDPPDGLSEIGKNPTAPSMAVTAGWTGVPNAAAFTAPRLDVTETMERKQNNMVEHFATVRQTKAADAVLESYYPGVGDHLGSVVVHKGITYKRYWRITQAMSDLIRDGEQEHINDAQRAYDITYKLIEAKINLLAMGGKRFGPATTPEKAYLMAQAELFTALPPELRIGYGGWVVMLDLLLKMTHLRDARGWHSLGESSQKKGATTVSHLTLQSSTKIKQVPSEQLVNYPTLPPGP